MVEWAAKEWGVDRVILIPDEFLARNVAAQTTVGIIAWKGHCEVHKRFTAQDIADMRDAWPDAEVLAHPECPEEILAASDFAGSTAAMTDYVEQRRPKRVVLITECSMASNIKGDVPSVEFVGPCNLCPHMKRITLQNIPRLPGVPAVRGDGARGDDRARASGRAAHDRPAAARRSGPLTTSSRRVITWMWS